MPLMTNLIRAFLTRHRRIRAWLTKRTCTPRTIGSYLAGLGAVIGHDCFIVPTDIETQVDPGKLRIGNHVAIAAGVSFVGGHDGSLHFAGGASISSEKREGVTIHDNCFIGYRAIIYQGVTIGPNSVVSAGSVVMEDIPPNTIAIGVPARPFGSMERYRDKCIERWVEQRPPDAFVEDGHSWWSSPRHHANRELLRSHLLALFGDRLDSTAAVRNAPPEVKRVGPS
jgi:acetyltransferase-like isoleucine patch superfamily enzyme